MNIGEIAKLAGVSRATVSRFFNRGYLSEEKRVRIQKVIEETGYVPSASAQALRTKKSRQIGVIVPKISSESISHIVDGVSTVLDAKGYYTILGNTGNHAEKEREFLKIFQHNGTDGIILIATCLTRQHWKDIKSLKIPIILVGQEAKGVSCIYHDDYHAAKAVTKALLRGSNGKIAYLGVTEDDVAVGKHRKEGFLAALQDENREIAKKDMRICTFSYDSGYEQMKGLLGENPEIDSVFCATDTIAGGAIQAIRESGRRIPEDIAVTGVGGNRLASVVQPKLTTVRYYYHTSGVEAANMLLERMEKKEKEIQRTGMMLGYEMIEGESTRKI